MQRIDWTDSHLIRACRISEFLPVQRRLGRLLCSGSVSFHDSCFHQWCVRVLSPSRCGYQKEEFSFCQPSSILKYLSLPRPLPLTISWLLHFSRTRTCSCKWVRRCGRVDLFAGMNVNSFWINACLLPQTETLPDWCCTHGRYHVSLYTLSPKATY